MIEIKDYCILEELKINNDSSMLRMGKADIVFPCHKCFCNLFHYDKDKNVWVCDNCGEEYDIKENYSKKQCGEWIDLGADYWDRGRTSTRYKCSICSRRAGEKQVKLYDYCPKCGSKMRRN